MKPLSFCLFVPFLALFATSSIGQDVGPLRIAVAAEDGGKNAADLLVAKLNGQPGLEILERVDLGVLLRERQFDFQKAETQLSGASSVLLIETVKSGGQDYLVARLISVRTGLLQWNAVLPHNDLEKAVNRVAIELPAAIQSISGKVPRAALVSLKSFAPRFDPTRLKETTQEGIAFLRLLAASLSATSGILVAERLALDLPGLENDLAGLERAGFPNSEYQIEGDYHIGAEGEKSSAEVVVTVSGSTKSRRETIDIDATSPVAVAGAVARAARQLIAGLREQPATNNVNRGLEPTPSLFADANAAQDEAQRLFQLGQYREAERRAASGLELCRDEQPGLLAVLALAKTAAVFQEIGPDFPPPRGRRYYADDEATTIPIGYGAKFAWDFGKTLPKPGYEISPSQWKELTEVAWMLHDAARFGCPGQHTKWVTKGGKPNEYLNARPFGFSSNPGYFPRLTFHLKGEFPEARPSNSSLLKSEFPTPSERLARTFPTSDPFELFGGILRATGGIASSQRVTATWGAGSTPAFLSEAEFRSMRGLERQTTTESVWPGDEWLADQVNVLRRVLGELLEARLWRYWLETGKESLVEGPMRELFDVLRTIPEFTGKMKSRYHPECMLTEFFYEPDGGRIISELRRKAVLPFPVSDSRIDLHGISWVRFLRGGSYVALDHRMLSDDPENLRLTVHRDMKWPRNAPQGKTVEQIIRASLAETGDEYDPIRRTLLAHADYSVAFGTDREETALQVLVERILAEGDALARLGVAPAMARAVFWEGFNAITAEGRNKRPGPASCTQLRAVHKVALLGTKIDLDLTNSILRYADPINSEERLPEAVRKQFQRDIAADLIEANDRAAPGNRLKEYNISKYRTLAASAAPAPIPAAAAQDSMLKLDVNFYAYSDPDLPLVEIAERDFVFYFLVGSSDPEEVKIVVFDPMNSRFLDPIKPPGEFAEALSRRAWDTPYIAYEDVIPSTGSIAVNGDDLIVASAGVIAVYSFGTKSWRVLKIPFMENKDGIQISGRQVICQGGEPAFFGGIGPKRPKLDSHGLYSVSVDDEKITTHMDTSRRPQVAPEDAAQTLTFDKKPIALGGGNFLVSNKSPVRLPTLYQWQTLAISGGQRKEVVKGAGLPPSGNPSDGGAGIVYSVDFYQGSNRHVHYFALRVGPNLETTPLVDYETIEVSNRPHFWPPMVVSKGREIWLLSGEMTDDGRRILKYWPDEGSSTPIPISLRLGGLLENKRDLMKEEDKRKIEEKALANVERMYFNDRALVFMTKKGLWLLSKKKWENFISDAVKRPAIP